MPRSATAPRALRRLVWHGDGSPLLVPSPVPDTYAVRPFWHRTPFRTGFSQQCALRWPGRWPSARRSEDRPHAAHGCALRLVLPTRWALRATLSPPPVPCREAAPTLRDRFPARRSACSSRRLGEARRGMDRPGEVALPPQPPAASSSSCRCWRQDFLGEPSIALDSTRVGSPKCKVALTSPRQPLPRPAQLLTGPHRVPAPPIVRDSL